MAELMQSCFLRSDTPTVCQPRISRLRAQRVNREHTDSSNSKHRFSRQFAGDELLNALANGSRQIESVSGCQSIFFCEPESRTAQFRAKRFARDSRIKMLVVELQLDSPFFVPRLGQHFEFHIIRGD